MLYATTGVYQVDKEQIDKLCENKPSYIRVTVGELAQLKRYAGVHLTANETLAGMVYSYRSIQLYLV